MLRLAELVLRTAHLKSARGLPAIMLALSRILWAFGFLVILWRYPPDSWPVLMAILPKLVALASR